MHIDRQIEILYLIIKGLKDKTRDNQEGICAEITGLYFSKVITESESVETKRLISKNRPSETLFRKLFRSPDYRPFRIFWWEPISRDKNMLRPRITYLHSLIYKIISDEENN